MDDRGFASIADLSGKALSQVTDWNHLDLNYEVVARIDAETCIACNLCHIACEDGAHQCIAPAGNGVAVPEIDEEECIGCNLCALICPVPDCITMVEIDNGRAPETYHDRQARRRRLMKCCWK